MYRFKLALAVFAAPFLAVVNSAASADTLEDIKAKGELVAGIKTDYPPYGFRDKSGKIAGIEPELAADIAQKLGVRLRIEPVVSSNRIQFLQQGKVDLIIATLGVTEERRKAVGFIDPPYYASGIAVLVNPKAHIKSVAGLKGMPVCVVQGNLFNRDLQAKYVQTDLLAFKAVPEAEQALLSGQCVAFSFDDTLLTSKKKFEADRWKDFDLLPIPDAPPVPWAIAVKLEDRDQPWGKFISETVTGWHKTGRLIEIEKKWLGSNTNWILEAAQKTTKHAMYTGDDRPIGK
jgi:polar amino acid transport system substrate-binding protein